MLLDHYPMLAERRFQPSERLSFPTADSLPLPTSSWSYIPRSHNVVPQDYTSTASQWNTNLMNHSWSPDNSAPSSSYPTAPTHYRHSGSNALNHQSEYPESSHRTVPPIASPSLSAGLSSPTSYERAGHLYSSSASSNVKYPSSHWRDDLYALDGADASNIPVPPPSTARTSTSPPSVRAASRSSSAGTPPVKLEPEEPPSADCFVMEFTSASPAVRESSSLAPPTEVPLRATQASKAMRKMMGVFRLNPFSMHEGGGQALASWSGEDARPLEEEPQMFEFQLDIGGEGENEDEEQHKDPSPDREAEVDENELTRWTEDEGPQLACGSHPQSDWMANESIPSNSYALPSLRACNQSSHSPSLSSTSSRRTPFDIPASEYSAGSYTLPLPHSCSSSADNLPSLASMARKWSVPSGLQAQFMIQ
ncbi:hypothetical protein BV22DRAFT_861994 [Leucogyrophana mollusca]|uniref:Uncharacterized protein n=1 Tax=Leucogyrophana mollusca TaxID=85980 RepID=A0ACB8B0P9_9AGAM|nr:hypothetical protein BV22DRAFT_861994 [Leucogyrophana mollusca]